MNDYNGIGALVRIEAALLPHLNLAFHHNAVPFLHELVVVNESERALDGVELTVSSEPAFLAPRTWRIERIEAGGRHRIGDLDVALDPGLLSRLTEAEPAEARFRLEAGGVERARLERAIELLPRTQWTGLGHVPEMVAAFVQPNDPAIDPLLKQTAEILRRNGRDGALNGYEGGAARAWELSSALWNAVAALGLDYSLPPASFERTGQKARGPSQVVEVRLATCLDSTLLFCAALEQLGLNPLLVFTKGHVFAGLWLRPEEFTTPVVDDSGALRKRVRLQELLVFETTLVAQRPVATFGQAVERGARQVSDEEADNFILAVDVRRARLQRIRPLASTEGGAVPPADTAAPEEPRELAFEAAPPLPAERPAWADESPATPQGRLERWQRKLLDLSLRNSLLNFKVGKKAIRLVTPDPGGLEDLLADGRKMRLLPHPDLMDGTDPRSRALHEARHHEDARQALARDALARDQVLVELAADELDTRLTELYRQARSTLQEGGANTLFLAYGFLVWTAKDDQGKSYRAPLILLPVTLERKSVRGGFSLTLHEDEPRFNPTLVEMLRQDFKLTLPIAEGELPKDEHGLDIAGIWRTVAQAVKEIKGWEVADDVVLASFSFAKYLMWKDLVERTDQLRQNPVVRHLLDSPRDPYPGDHRFADPRALDATHPPEKVFCPLPADSSQMSAVMTAAQGRDFVLIGPPGTGKSQTIANLIAQCLAERKTVLFVSEKIAALDVVYRRLREVGLGEFCLELHSNKARKVDVLDQLRTAWEAKGEIDADEWAREAQRLKSLRDDLNLYVERLHRTYRNGLTPHSAIGQVLAGRDRPRLGLSWPGLDAHDREQREDLARMAERLDILAAQVDGIASNPLALVDRGEWSPLWQQRLLAAAEAVTAGAESVAHAVAAFRQAGTLPDLPLDRAGREAVAALAALLPRAAGHDWRFVFRPDARALADGLREGMALLTRRHEQFSALADPWPGEVTGALRRAVDLLHRHHEIVAQLGLPVGTSLEDADPHALKESWDQAAGAWWLKRTLGQRKVSKAVLSLVPPGRSAPPAEDLDRLVALAGIERDLGDLAPAIAASGIPWGGLSSSPSMVSAALRLNTILDAVHQGQPWVDEGLETIGEGACGPALAETLARLRALRGLEGRVAALDDLTTRTGGLWAGLQSRGDEIAAALAFQADLEAVLPRLATTAETMGAMKGALERLLGDGNALLGAGCLVMEHGAALRAALAGFASALDAFGTEAGAPLPDEAPAALAERCRSILPLAPRLRDWCAWRGARATALAHGLGPLVAGLEAGAVVPGEARSVFEVAYARWWLDLAIEGDVVLRQFSPALHENRIQAFKDLDDRFTQLTRDMLRAGLCAGLPAIDAPTQPSSDWGLLRREMQKQRNHLPLRVLLHGLPKALPRLTPCLLMSPLSIAQYLTPEAPPFDVVVFDEASQIAVWDAIGAIARGRQVVMVGDPKQLPPTDFFARGQSDEEENGDTEPDMESILDECIGASLPILDLSWHYRSRHESLIAFSNHRYYGGALVTFPSPVTDDRAVSFHFVENGVYEKGGARTNPAEAKALVADLIGHLKDPSFVAAKRTIGVVTFNAEQQKLIEDLLDAERRKDPALDPFFAEDALEPVMVKNLENVQGDERDLIYFSITYGPDRSGTVSMNFGPMNKSGGGRRLNVAVTRARHALKVFSTLHPDQIDLSRTQAEGVRDLKHFMEFAGRGPRALGEAVMGSVGGYESPFERMVAEALAARGWRVHPQIGVSRFRIDLGIVDPDAPGRFLAGIECDGATYHRAATARDRDKLREQVLRGLGWEIVRIWSTDWWIDPQGALEKVEARLAALLEETRARRAAPPEPEIVESAPPTAEAATLARPRPADDLFVGEDFTLTPPGGAVPAARPAVTEEAMFVEADPAQAGRPDPAAFNELSYDATLRAMIRRVIETEGPVRDDVLARRIARAHGWTRTGSKIQDRVSALARLEGVVVTEGDATFVWPKGADPARVAAFRRPSGEQARPVDEIALPELVALAREIRATGREGEAALTAMARTAGLHQLRQASRSRLNAAWARMEAEG